MNDQHGLFSLDVVARLVLHAGEVIDLLTDMAIGLEKESFEQPSLSQRADALVTTIVAGK